jgi:hypothetical protein
MDERKNGWMAVMFGLRELGAGALRGMAERQWAKKKAKESARAQGTPPEKAEGGEFPGFTRLIAGSLKKTARIAVAIGRKWRFALALLAAMWIGSAMVRATGAATGDTLWVNWSAAQRLVEATAPAGSEAFKGQRQVWLDALGGRGEGWRRAQADALSDKGEAATMAECLREGACAWMRASWRPALGALLSGRAIQWADSPLNAGMGLPGVPASQRAALEAGSQAVYGRLGSGMSLFGAGLGALAFFVAWIGWGDAVTAAQEEAARGSAKTFALAAQGAFAASLAASAAAASGAMLLVVMFFSWITPDGHWVAPVIKDFAHASQSALPQATGWEIVNPGNLAISLGLTDETRAKSVSEKTAGLAIDQCKRLGLCERVADTSVGEFLRFLGGRDPLAVAAGQRAGDVWGLRRQAAARSGVWQSAFIWGTLSFVASLLAMLFMAGNGAAIGQGCQRRLAFLAEKGAPAAERNALLAEAKKGARSAARASKMNAGLDASEEKGAKRKAPNRI